MIYEVHATEKFSKWLKKLKDAIAKASITRRIERLEEGNFGDCKSVGESLFELRINVGKGYRVYFTNINKQILLLLIGGDKSTQEKDIKTAKKMMEEL